MNLKSRIGELLQGRPVSRGSTSLDTEAIAREEEHRRNEAQKLHMKRLSTVRNRELDSLRAIMVRRREKHAGEVADQRVKRGAPNMVTRPPGLIEGTQMVSLINELEVKVLSEPMGLTAPPTPHAMQQSSSEPSNRACRPSSDSSSTHFLDDAALMMAARSWEQAGELLLRAVDVSKMTREVDWIVRCAADLFDRGGCTQLVAEVRQQYLQRMGHAPGRIVPPKLAGSVIGLVHPRENAYWQCPSRLGPNDALHLQTVLRGTRTDIPFMIDWSALSVFEAAALSSMQRLVEMAMQSRTVFVQVGLSRLIRVVRQELQEPTTSETWWKFWLTLMNWNGFRHAHRAGATAFSKRFRCDAPAHLSTRCLCYPLNKPASGVGPELVTSVQFLGELCREHAQELEALATTLKPSGGMVLLDCRFLTSVDFFFCTDLLNWITRHHARGLAVSVTFAHPLLAHFFRMMGLQDYAKLHRLPPPVRP